MILINNINKLIYYLLDEAKPASIQYSASHDQVTRSHDTSHDSTGHHEVNKSRDTSRDQPSSSHDEENLSDDTIAVVPTSDPLIDTPTKPHPILFQPSSAQSQEPPSQDPSLNIDKESSEGGKGSEDNESFELLKERVSNLETENSLLRQEIRSLNEELNNVVSRAKTTASGITQDI